MVNQPEVKKKSKKQRVLTATLATAVVAAVIGFSYITLSKLKERDAAKSEGLQEQFAGAVQVSGQLQSECQKSAEKISELISTQGNLGKTFTEYKQNAEGCREVYFVIGKNTQSRSEGMYPDLAVDIAVFAAKTDKVQAAEILKFALGIGVWEFYMGPIVCNSKTTIEAYLESLSLLPDDKICYKPKEDTEKLFVEIKNRNFSVLMKSLDHDRVVTIASPESEIGCPEKISTITKIVQSASAGNLNVDMDETKNSDKKAVNFIFKTKEEDRLILEFAEINDCLQLQTVLIPNLHANE